MSELLAWLLGRKLKEPAKPKVIEYVHVGDNDDGCRMYIKKGGGQMLEHWQLWKDAAKYGLPYTVDRDPYE